MGNILRMLHASLGAAALSACLLAAHARAQDEGPARQAPPVLRLGTLAPEGTPWADTLERLRETIERAGGGGLKVKLYLNGRAGDEPEMLERIAEKKLEGGGFTSTGLAGVVPEVGLLELPFLFESDAEADFVLDEVVGPDLARRFEAKGLHLYIWAVNGWVDIGSAGKPILAAADLAGRKPYAREGAAREGFWKAIGATPTVLPVPEVLAALRAGKVDVYDTTPLFGAAAGWTGATKHWTDSNHIYQPAAVVFDLAWWKGLPESVRKALDEAAPALQAEARRAVRGLDASLMAEFRREGIEVHPLSPEARTGLVAATAMLEEDPAFAASKDLLAKVRAALEKRRKERGAAAAGAPAAKPDPLKQHLAAADRYLAARPSVGDLNRAEFELQEALRHDPKSYDAMFRMARAKIYLGKYGPEGAKLAKFESAIDWAKKAVERDGARVEGHFWLAVAYGLFGETKGITSSLFLVDDMQESLERAEKIDATYDGGGPPRILGRLYFKLPWAAGGSNKKALKNLRKAMSLDAAMPHNYTYLAEVLIDEDEEREAREVLEKLLAMPADPRWAQEHKEACEDARRLLKKL